MSLINEINIKKKFINAKSSLIEKIFYSFLTTGGTGKSALPSKASNFEKIAYSSFDDSSFDIKEILKKEQKVDSKFDFHYSKNIIELSAMSLADFDFEKSNIINFLKTASLKEAFVISKIFTDFSYPDNGNTETKVDELVYSIFVKKDLSNSPNSIIEAIQSADDLIDIFIIEKCHENYVSIHPVTDTKKKLSFLINSIDKYNTLNETRIKRMLFGKTVFLLTVLGGILVYVIPKYWDEYSLEPIVTVILLVSSWIVIVIPLYFSLFHKLDGTKSILKKYINKKIQKLNSKLEIESLKIEAIRNELTNK
tara:strand:+ start:72 stop:998 length:927 start_codon:yes stop_codon:yes gene_type:complete